MEQILLLARLDGDALLEQFHPVNLATPGRRRTLRTGAPGHRQGHRAVVAPGDRARDGHRPVAEGDGRQPGGQRPAPTPAGGQVKIRVENRAQHAVLRVRDNGPGSPWKSSRRSSPAYRSPATSGEGSGLGLPIVKRIVELHFGVSAWARDWRARAGSAGVPAEDPAGRDAAAGQKVRTAGGHI